MTDTRDDTSTEDEGRTRVRDAFIMPGPRGRTALIWFGSTALLILVIYLLIPHLAGVEDTWNRIKNGSPAWLAAAIGLETCSYLGYAWNMAAVSAADGVILGVKRSALITLAATAATRLVAAGGAGGIAVTTWALSRAGHGPRQAAKQVSQHLVATYGVFMALVIAVGTALAIAGEDPLLSAVPAVIAALCVATFLVVIQAPDWIRRHLDTGPKWRRRLLAAPQALADGTHFTIELVQRRERGLWGTVFWWIFDFATLWACFWAFGGHPNVPDLLMAYLLGQLGNLLPLPGGVGGVEGGMVGAAAAFNMDAGVALVAVLAYRAISVWLPALPGVLALATLRKAAEGADVIDDAPEADADEAA
ncbi:lysylphosphatidylglycerol synthase transmembrane domain-containing protein [Conexibacter woesei]|uniref:lysylphosphatidylglycerol synthase transmembrane domain-containing protein n=1 Tax=Conexibacter woesei TaxID=191495 RepID=UPI000404231C|nr:YbhN family protein [Conexibacter woesei]